jgi:hypothetical protein
MPVAFVQEFPIVSRSTANYDYIAERIGDDPVDGLLFHSAGFDNDDNVFRIFDIWESQEQAQRFLDEKIQPLMPELPDQTNFSPPSRDGFYELHDYIKP